MMIMELINYTGIEIVHFKLHVHVHTNKRYASDADKHSGCMHRLLYLFAIDVAL